jgi:hypothetical protein
MNAWEEKLREALRRKAAPEGFAERVLARTRDLSEPVTKPWEWLKAFIAKPALRWAMAAVVLCLVITAGVVHRQRQERLRREGEIARMQVKQALGIASMKLNVALRKVQGVNQGAPQSRL